MHQPDGIAVPSSLIPNIGASAARPSPAPCRTPTRSRRGAPHPMVDVPARRRCRRDAAAPRSRPASKFPATPGAVRSCRRHGRRVTRPNTRHPPAIHGQSRRMLGRPFRSAQSSTTRQSSSVPLADHQVRNVARNGPRPTSLPARVPVIRIWQSRNRGKPDSPPAARVAARNSADTTAPAALPWRRSHRSRPRPRAPTTSR